MDTYIEKRKNVSLFFYSATFAKGKQFTPEGQFTGGSAVHSRKQSFQFTHQTLS